MTWRADAECAGAPDELFFPPTTSAAAGPVPDWRWHNARAICAVCPVIAECAEDALRHEEWGFRGGLTPAEQAKRRRAIRRDREPREECCLGCGAALASRVNGRPGPAPEGTVWHHARSLCRPCHYAEAAS